MRLYVDMTCAFEEAGRIAHGTLRVERGLVGALAAMKAPDLSFVRYDRARRRFLAVGRDDALAIVNAPTIAERRRGVRGRWRAHPVLERGRRFEKWIRDNIREPFRNWRAGVSRPGAIVSPSEPQPADGVSFAPGGVLLLVGELRQRQADLAALRRAGLRLAFVFYDLLNVLPDGDPRLNAARDVDLPFTDFMLREADHILSISQFSAGALRAHVARRGVPAPPIAIIRLSGALGSDIHDVPVPDLIPRGFVVCVGDINERKNQRLLIGVWRRLLMRDSARLAPLVLVGRADPSCARMIRDVQADAGLARRVRIMNNLSDGEVAWLYKNCRFAAFASLDEGFGLPVAESLGAGKVCVASSASAIPEAGQGAALLLDPHDIEAWDVTIARLLDDDAMLEALEERVRRDFHVVTWTDAAQDVLVALSCQENDPEHAPPGDRVMTRGTS